MQHTQRSLRRVFFYPVIVLCLLFALIISALPASAGAKTLQRPFVQGTSCPAVGDITAQSLLVVLLDRSGSLVYQPGATDPDGYSTSVTKALADLWPGKMAVIPFSNGNTPVIGPYSMADSSLRQLLKDRVQAYQIGGNTPLDPAMQQALALLKNAAAGSRVIIVTDGSPDPAAINGVNQANDIRQNLLPQFCSRGITVSAFGLALDLSQPDGQIANGLLTDIANATGGTYTNVRNAYELSQVVVHLYALWQHLTFLPANPGGNTYTVHIDTYAQHVTFVTFRGDQAYSIALNGPDGQPIPDQSLQRSTDRHYEIDDMVLSAINQPGTYTISVGDPQAHVYALVETQLHVVLVQPVAQTIAYIGHTLAIQAELMDGSSPIIPKPNEATINAQVQVLVNGRTVSTTIVELSQVNTSPVFAGQYTSHGSPGQVHVQIEAVYLQIPVEASQAQITIPLEKPPATSVGGTPACNAGMSCIVSQYRTFLIGGLSALLLAILLFLLLRRSTARDWSLVQGGQVVDLGTMGRSPLRKLFHKSVLSSQELEQYGGLDFHGEKFNLTFKHGVHFVVTGNGKIMVKQNGHFETVTKDTPPVELSDRDSIQVSGCRPASLHLHIPTEG